MVEIIYGKIIKTYDGSIAIKIYLTILGRRSQETSISPKHNVDLPIQCVQNTLINYLIELQNFIKNIGNR